MEDLENLEKLPVIEMDVRKVRFGDPLSGILGSRYKDWKERDVIFIYVSTGVGKTFFSVEDLSEWAMKQEVEIAILVNWRLLRGQLWRDIQEHDLRMNRRKVYLHLFSYQQLEGEGEEAKQCREILMRCRYIVCDECHYFLMDALFNPGVQRSFDFITTLYKDAALIFMSATMERIRPLLEKRILELHKCQMAECEKEMQEYDDRIYDSCQYKRNGEQRSLTEAWEKYEEAKESWEYQEKIEFYESQMALPQVREYHYIRDMADKITAKYFQTEEELADLIVGGSLPGKWLVFVAAKKFGKKMREELIARGADAKKIVYIDAEYDVFSATDESVQKRAREEVHNIVQTGRLQCQILITTSVLDNGVNIKDSQVTNIVLMTEDEDEFIQMLGRRRFTSENETINLFIFMGNPCLFSKRARTYFQISWKLCNNRDIYLPDAYKMLMEDPEKNTNMLSSYYDFDGWTHHSNELAIEAVRMRCLYYRKLVRGLEGDKYFFLKEQMRWLGKDCTQEWLESSSVLLSQSKIDAISEYLNLLYHREGVINKREFEEIEKKIIDTAAKMEPQKYKGKQGNFNTVNSALQMRKEWRKYQIVAVGDRKTFYEIYSDGKARYDIRADFTLEALKTIVEESTPGDMEKIWERMFDSEIPKCLAGDSESLKVYINGKLKKYQGLEGWILRSSVRGDGKKIVVGKRPNSSTE